MLGIGQLNVQPRGTRTRGRCASGNLSHHSPHSTGKTLLAEPEAARDVPWMLRMYHGCRHFLAQRAADLGHPWTVLSCLVCDVGGNSSTSVPMSDAPSLATRGSRTASGGCRVQIGWG